MREIIVALLLTLVVLFVPIQSIKFEKFDPFDKFWQLVVPKLLGQQPNNDKNLLEDFKDIALNDTLNEDIGNFSVQDIIKRSKFEYENHYVVSNDNYITQLCRIINPLADRRQLKQPPVMLMHGGLISPTAYVWGSSAQHHPEEYPRGPNSKPFTSFNRSLAFVLANNGYDVWLVGIRGADKQNQEHRNLSGPKSIDQIIKHKRKKSFLRQQKEAERYWMFTMDDEIEFELPRQIDKVMNVTGSNKVNLFTYSQSTQMSLALVSQNLDYAKKVHSLISMAPVLNDKGTNWLIRAYYRLFCTYVPVKLGTRLTSEMVLTKPMRKLILKINKNKYLRYSLLKGLGSVFFGSSAKYLTLLEPSVVWHSLMPISFQQLKHYCQQAVAGKLQKYDYGYWKNMKAYRSLKPKAIDISDLHIDNWMVISGTNDNFASPKSIEQVLRDVKHPKPYKHLIVDGYSHLDLIAAITNDVQVNRPVLDFFDHFQLPPLASPQNNSNQSTNNNANSTVPLTVNTNKLESNQSTNQPIKRQPTDKLN